MPCLAAAVSLCEVLWEQLSAKPRLPGRCGAALGALAAVAHERALGESAKVFPPPSKTTPGAAPALPTHELCSPQTFTFPDSKPLWQKFSFIFRYYFSCSRLRNTSPILIIGLFRHRQTKRFLKF